MTKQDLKIGSELYYSLPFCRTNRWTPYQKCIIAKETERDYITDTKYTINKRSGKMWDFLHHESCKYYSLKEIEDIEWITENKYKLLDSMEHKNRPTAEQSKQIAAIIGYQPETVTMHIEGNNDVEVG